jgi:hypothetical protein
MRTQYRPATTSGLGLDSLGTAVRLLAHLIRREPVEEYVYA